MKILLAFLIITCTSCQQKPLDFPPTYKKMTAEIHFQSGFKFIVENVDEDCSFIVAAKEARAFNSPFVFEQDGKSYILNMQKAEQIILSEN